MTQILELGSDFAGYRIEALIGRGGMGEVYRAEHPRLGNKVALKLLAPALAEDELFRERFVRESRLAASLNHPNVIPIFDAGEVESLPYIAMRFVEGADLKSLVQRDGPLQFERALSIVSQVAGALDCGHERGLIHRDVKPANILLEGGTDGDKAHVYLTDFGVAKHMLSKSGLTSTGQFVGTIDYIAPEQIEGKPLDGRADVYSLGCVFFEALTGVSPFDRDSNVAMMYAHLLEPPPSLSESRPDLPSKLDEVIATALAKDPAERYPTCQALVVAARAFEGPAAAPVAAPSRASVVGAAPPKAPTNAVAAPPQPAGRRPSKRLVALVAAAAAALLAATAAGMTLMSGEDSGDSGRTPAGDERLSPGEAGFSEVNPLQEGARRPRPVDRLRGKSETQASARGDRLRKTGRAKVDRLNRKVRRTTTTDRIREPFTGGTQSGSDRLRSPTPPPPPPPSGDRLRGGAPSGGGSSGGDRLRP